MLTFDRFTADFREEVIVERLQQMGLLRSSCVCDCGNQMTAARCADYRDDIVFRCTLCWRKKICSNWHFFARSRLRLRQIMIIVANWIIKSPVTLSAAFADVTETSAVQWYEYCRDICAMKMTQVHESFGVVEKIVEIDEAVVRKRKYNKGRFIKEDWVLGFYDRSTQKGHFQRVRNRQVTTIIPIIKEYVQPGTTIYTDDWKAYRCLSRLGFVHHVVVHKRHFVDPTTGVHTNNIEGMWSSLKYFLRPYDGSRGRLLWSHMDEFLYRMHYDFKTSEPLSNLNKFVNHVKEEYPL
ncbi:hypothetical protein MS3_00008923 [Schistosoma haematobium]|uniref:ISXO2-like transposase domain-containing protein n=1 Tax=Schistosoma haematobium TaxID=6185 RepID=A0A922LDW0_SCHHA|nr:hypothetical protein MS3_00008923 [Schistosoma haematobium]KAH9580213.1 hypothetical protein MS3_00008923 [Schistosoma haematobium]